MTTSTGQRQTTSRAAQAAETRRRLVGAAIELFSERSFDEVAVADIARAAGVANGLLFHYFPSKRGIYLEAMREASEQLLNAFAFQADLPPSQQLRGAFDAHLRYLYAHRGLALRLVLGGRGSDPEAWEVFEAGRLRALEAGASVLGIDPDNNAVRMALRSAVGAIDEASIYWLENQEPFPVAAVVDYLIQLIASALRSASIFDPTLDTTAAVEALLNSNRD